MVAPRDIHPGTRAMAGGSLSMAARAYFRFRPFLPRRACWALRRLRVARIMRLNGHVWPIDAAAERAPAGWSGWPQNKGFALVLTHDVESSRGLHQVRDLAELELECGLRASYNFIPAGSYQDPVRLRKWLGEHQFEVGVHDLKHDGRLYQSRQRFERKAKSINGYLAHWGAVGFRSAFMLHQLEWLHDLDIRYDCSTFDTDPFEPQPYGSQTIFPFLVRPPAGSNKPAYVELSYTLPQDSTLFLLLRETTPTIWLRKLDWIARKGGLALVNIHPDYIDFSGGGCGGACYPVALVQEFFDYIRNHYAGMYWNPLAGELAEWFRQTQDANPAAHAEEAGVGNCLTK